MRCAGLLLRASFLGATQPLRWFGPWSAARKGKDPVATRQRQAASQHFLQGVAAGLGRNAAGARADLHEASSSEFPFPDEGGGGSNASANAGQRGQDGTGRWGSGFEAHVQGASKENSVDDIFLRRPAHLTGEKRYPLMYEIEARRRAQRQDELERQHEKEHSAHYDEWNMPREPQNPDRPRANWEFTATPEHKALILLLYRNILKGLMNFKSVRKRSMIAYARFAFRRRANATEKFLIDECVEECRRAIYVLEKHHNFTRTRTYEFDTMTMPKDTGQDVKSYMEEVYDPEMSRMQFQNFTDVQHGKEHLHKQGLSPTSGANHWKKQRSLGQYNVEIREEDKTLRPPPPPEMAS